MGIDDGHDYREHYADLSRQLQSLRTLFSLNESLSSFRAYFEEELDANEFEIALDALCDFLLEPTTPGIATAQLEKIDAAFGAMKLDDDRTAALHAKSQIWNNWLHHAARNEQLIAVLNQKAVSITDARTIELHFWAWSEAGARSIAGELETRGMVIQRVAPAQCDTEPDAWSVEASVERSVETVTAAEFIREMITLAAKQSGEFDGWGTSV